MACVYAHERVGFYVVCALLRTAFVMNAKAQEVNSFGSVDTTEIANKGWDPSTDKVVLKCDTSSMCMYLDKEWLATQWEVTSIAQLALRQRCDESAQDADTHFVLCTGKGKLSSCGSEFSQNNTHASFTNNVHILQLSPPGGVVTPVKASIPWTCTYPLKVLVGLKFSPQITPVTIFLGNHAGYGEFEAAMYLYEDENFENAYNPMQELHVTDRLRVKLQLLQGPTMSRLQVVKCWGTSVPTTGDKTSTYTIIDDYCPTVEGLKADVILRNNGDLQYVLLESDVFRFVESPEVYVHCRVKVCFEESKCEKKCSNGSDRKARRRRDVTEELGNELLSIGPITVGSDVPKVPTSPRATQVKEGTAPSPKDSGHTIMGMPRTAVYVMIATLATVCVVLAIAISVLRCRMSRLRTREKTEKFWKAQAAATRAPQASFTLSDAPPFEIPIYVPNTIAKDDRRENSSPQ